MTCNREQTHIPCPCGRSSDAYVKYTDGHGYCFSCKAYHPAENGQGMLPSDNTNTSVEFVAYRGISESTMRKYGAVAEVSGDGHIAAMHFPYGPGAKVRYIREGEKDRHTSLNMKDEKATPLFGMDRFPPGSAPLHHYYGRRVRCNVSSPNAWRIPCSLCTIFLLSEEGLH